MNIIKPKTTIIAKNSLPQIYKKKTKIKFQEKKLLRKKHHLRHAKIN